MTPSPDAGRGATPARIVLALLAVYLIWGSTYLGIRFALEGGYPPLLMAGGRFIIAGGLMYAVLRMRGVPAPTKRQWRDLIILGLLLLGGGNGMVTIAQQTVSSGLAAVAVFAAMRREYPNKLEWLGLAIGFVGVLWLNAGSSLTATPQGLVLLLIAAIAWSFGSVWSRGRDLPSPFMGAAAQMLCGGVLMLVAGVVSGERMHELPTAKGTFAVAYLVGFGSIVAFSAYIWLLHNVRTSLAGSYAYVNPVIAVVLGAWLAAERFTVSDFGAMAVILCGVVAITLGKAKKKKPAAAPQGSAEKPAEDAA